MSCHGRFIGICMCECVDVCLRAFVRACVGSSVCMYVYACVLDNILVWQPDVNFLLFFRARS